MGLRAFALLFTLTRNDLSEKPRASVCFRVAVARACPDAVP